VRIQRLGRAELHVTPPHAELPVLAPADLVAEAVSERHPWVLRRKHHGDKPARIDHQHLRVARPVTVELAPNRSRGRGLSATREPASRRPTPPRRFIAGRAD